MTDNTTDTQISATEWRQLRVALTERLRSLIAARDSAPSPAEAERLQKEIELLKKQVSTLAVEETVAQFVEDAERYIINANTVAEELNRDPDEEIA